MCSTDLRAILIYVKANHKNVTISLPEGLLQQFRVYAASRNLSMTQLIESAVRKMIADGPADEERRRRFFERLDNPPNLGTHGKATWTRDEIHDRGIR